MNKNDLGKQPAFPDGYTEPGSDASGLTKREYIATKCLAALISYDGGEAESDSDGKYIAQNAQKAAKYADALIAELSKNT